MRTFNTDEAPLLPLPGTAEAPASKQICRLGFMESQFSVPDDFDQIAAEEIERLFYGE
jgi:hypothetical protein